LTSQLAQPKPITRDNPARAAAFINWPVLYAEMDRLKIDSFVAAEPQSIFYLSGSYIDCNIMFFDRLAMVVVPRNGAETFIVCNIEEAVVKTVSWVDDIRTFAQFYESAGKLAEVLEDRGLAHGRIGLEEKFLPVKFYRRLEEKLPHATFVSADDVVDKARARKLPTEVDFLKAAATLSDEAVEAAWKQCHPGVTEYELSIAMTQEMLARGGNRVEHVCIGAGINTHTLRHKPSDKRLERGDLFYADFGVVKNMYGSGSGYWSDLCRMGVVGEPSREQRAHYKLLRDVQQAIIARMKPGARCNDLYLFAREAFLQAGVDDVLPNIGHSMARSRAQEKPVLEALDSTALEPNMVFAVGPSFRSGAERYELKDLVLVTDSGPKLLSDRWDTKDLFVLK